MMYKKNSEEVLVANDAFIALDHSDIRKLIHLAKQNKRKRIRVCIHRNDQEITQEMFIVHLKDAYIRPHKHIKRNESLYILDGSASILFFQENGEIDSVLRMGNFESGKKFYYKIETPVFHSMIINSEYLVFLEITQGPFSKKDSLFAPWSPEETDAAEVKKYISQLKKSIDKYE